MDDQELFEQTRQQHGAGHLAAARAGYEELLRRQPENGQLCYLLALLFYEGEELDQAEKWFRRTVKLAPLAAPAHYNLGIIAADQGRLKEAAGHYQEALALTPDDNDIRFNLALSLKQLGRYQEAHDQYQTILQSEPADTDTLYNLGVTQQAMAEHDQAISSLEQVLASAPDHLAALNNLGYLYHRQGRFPEAIAVYRQLVAAGHNQAAAGHMLAALTGEQPATAPAAYVRDVFDQFSDHYEESLTEKLAYDTPGQLRDLLKRYRDKKTYKLLLDLGCGTGLSGLAFQDIARKMVGLDLSTKMLAKAKEKGIYSELHGVDIASYLQDESRRFELIVAADVFVYIGELGEIFAAVRRNCAGGAPFLFSCEGSESETFGLKESGRYGHNPAYIEALAEEHGFTLLAREEARIRKEKGEWISGSLFLLTAAP
ncbi:MAG: tetratricopeptide repeat protein [Thermodesulfobacteriota bacterium]